MSATERFDRVRESDRALSTLATLRSRWALILGVVAVCVAFAVYHNKHAPKSYAATASVAFQSGTPADAALNISTGGSTEPQREANTEVLIAHSSEVANAVRGELQGTVSAGELLEDVSIEAAPSADVLNVTATTPDPNYSARLANAFANQYIAFRSRSQLAAIAASEARLQQQMASLPEDSPSRTALNESLRRLGELRAVVGGGASIISLATPPSEPTGLHLSTAAIMGLLIGLAIALALVFLLESLDRRIKSIEDFEREYGLTALASIPRLGLRSSLARDRVEMLEPYRILRSGLDFAAVARDMSTLLITSAVAGEGKTTVSVDLSHAIALTGRRVVLVELDLRKSTFSRHFGTDGKRGITDVLTHQASVWDVMVEPFPHLPNFSVLPAGRVPHNPSELLGSPRLADILGEVSSADGIVILDAPPLNPVADTHVLLNSPAVHAVLIVGRIERTTRDQVRRARAILDRNTVEPVGIVVTGMRDGDRYGYGSYGAVEPAPEVTAEALSHAPGDPEGQRLSL